MGLYILFGWALIGPAVGFLMGYKQGFHQLIDPEIQKVINEAKQDVYNHMLAVSLAKNANSRD